MPSSLTLENLGPEAQKADCFSHPFLEHENRAAWSAERNKQSLGGGNTCELWVQEQKEKSPVSVKSQSAGVSVPQSHHS